MVKVAIPTPLRSYTAGRAEVLAPGDTVLDTLVSLVGEFPGLQAQLFAPDGRVRGFVNLFVNGLDIGMADGVATRVEERDELEIVPAIAGGSGPRDFAAWRAELQAETPQTEPGEASALVAKGALLLDVRSAEEWRQGRIPDAVHLDRGFLEARIEAAAPDRGAPIICYCESGVRSLFAVRTLEAMGYARASSLSGGFQRWKAEGRAVVRPDPLAEAAERRYLRHLSMPEVGSEGQRKLADGRVLIIGAGGLGCPAALYLAAAGVGRLGLVDDDVVEESNLQRQVLYTPAAISQPKAESARASLQAFNPLIRVDAYVERLTPQRAASLFPEYDVVLDATDNFRSRYLINDAAVACGRPVVHGAVYRFDGQVSVFGLPDGPCYRCFSPEAPPPELAPSCAEGGVLGVLPGVVGLTMAVEVLKLLLGVGEPLAGRMTKYDGLSGRFRELRFGRRAGCPACGDATGPARRAEPAEAAAT